MHVETASPDIGAGMILTQCGASSPEKAAKTSTNSHLKGDHKAICNLRVTSQNLVTSIEYRSSTEGARTIKQRSATEQSQVIL